MLLKFLYRALTGVPLPVRPLLLCLWAATLCAQAPPAKLGFAAVSNIKLSHDKRGATIEITASQPVEPTISQLDSPPRIVIDLPNSRVAVRSRKIHVGADRISAIRVDQFQNRPPVTRVVVDLMAPHKFLWSLAGNLLLVTLEPAAPPEPPPLPSVPSADLEPEPVAMPVSAPVPGAVTIDSSHITPGSSVTAGRDTTSLRLARGGEVRVCPGTTVSVTPSSGGRDLMLAMSTGALETHYRLDASSDSVLTPDFRIQFPGPGEFHFAISSDAQGNTCVRALMGNSAAAVVSELMGDRTYQVRPTDQLVFHSGRLDQVDASVPLECGCPPAHPPVLRAETAPEALPESKAPTTARIATAEDQNPLPPNESPMLASNLPLRQMVAGTETAPLPPATQQDIQVRLEAPIVFRASDLPPAPATKPSAIAISNSSNTAKTDPTAPLPPTAPAPTVTVAKAEKKGFFQKVGGFFAAIFR